MEKNFWQDLRRPIIGMSPMDGVTDAAMRYITAKYSKPQLQLMYTEFVSAEGLMRAKRKEKLLEMFEYDEIERPILAQVFGSDPTAFREAGKLIVKLGFDGMDINMGCPAKSVAARGGGAALIKTPKLAREIVVAAKEGVAGKVPVSVKTRVGYDKKEAERWVSQLLEAQPVAIAMHGRTLSQGYGGKADWEELGRAAKIVKEAGILFLGNGDVESVEEAREKVKKYDVDGVLLGRLTMGNPWVFKGMEVDIKERLRVMVEHAKKFEELFVNQAFFPMRKHLGWYCRDFEGAKQLRIELMQCGSAIQVERVVKRFLV